MDIWDDVNVAIATPDDEAKRARPDEQDPTGRYNEYGKNWQFDIDRNETPFEMR